MDCKTTTITFPLHGFYFLESWEEVSVVGGWDVVGLRGIHGSPVGVLIGIISHVKSTAMNMQQ